MGSFGSGSDIAVVKVEEVFKANVSSSSSEPPMEEWSSLFRMADIVEEKPDKGPLFDPGSGEVCAKYIAQSDSDVFAHLYYNYPCILDPGIMKALLKPEDIKVYNPDGQELYLDLCEKMNICPVRIFYRSLFDEVIDLKYYCVNPAGVRAMTLALQNNPVVRRLDLSYSQLSADACYHLGQLLGENGVLQELVLSGCKIKAEGVRRIAMRLAGRSMEVLDLSSNDLEDQGVVYLAEQITKGAVIKRLNLSNNGMGVDSAVAFSEALEGNNSIVELNLSWNKLFTPKGINSILLVLSDSEVLTTLNLAWNSLTVSQPFRRLLRVPTLKVLDLNSNRLNTQSVRALCGGLKRSKRLMTLDLSYNPITPSDATSILELIKKKTLKLQNLLMEDVIVDRQFMMMLKEVLSMPHRKNAQITHGMVTHNYVLSVPDMRNIVMKRLYYITNSVKACSLDIAVYFLTLVKQQESVQPKELVRTLKQAKAAVDEDLIDELSNIFPGPKTGKGEKTISLGKVVEYVHRLWPDKRPVPTPPPEPEPVAPAKADKKKKKK